MASSPLPYSSPEEKRLTDMYSSGCKKFSYVMEIVYVCMYMRVCVRVCVCVLSTYNGALAHERFTIQMRNFDLREGLELTSFKTPQSYCRSYG